MQRSTPYILFALITATLVACTTGQNAPPASPPTVDPVATVPSTVQGLPPSGQFHAVCLSDLDADGRIDIAGGTASPGTVSIWYANDTGGFDPPLIVPVRGDVQDLAAGDIDSDGRNDLILSVRNGGVGLVVLGNRPDRKWSLAPSPAQSNLYRGIDVADVNNDQIVDIVAANRTAADRGGIQVWLGDGRGGWLAESGPTTRGIYMDAVVADVNADGFPDVVGAGWGVQGELNLWLGDGRGGWAPASRLTEGSYYGLTAADIDNDGRVEILASSYRNGFHIFFGEGNGRFRQFSLPEDTGSYHTVLAMDIDGDGFKDVVAGSMENNGIRTWAFDGVERFSALNNLFPETGYYHTMAVGDVNGDGTEDLAAAGFGEGIKVWLSGPGTASSMETRRYGAMLVQSQPDASEMVRENAVFTTAAGFDEYKIGPGDQLELILWKGTEGVKEEVTVRPDGTISFAYIEDLEVRGLTPRQLDRILTERLEEFIKTPRLDVLVTEFGSKYVTILGAVGARGGGSGPGRYELSGRSRVIEMLSEAGGPLADANLRDIRVTRQNRQTVRVNLYKALTQGDLSQDLILDDGDTVYVPIVTRASNRVYVFGEVDNPGVYPFIEDEMRLYDAVAAAGGDTVFAHRQSVKVVRGDVTNPEVISVDLKALIEQGDQTQNVVLANGDLVYVPRSFVGDINRFVQQITPLFRLIIFPAQTVNEYGRAGDYLRGEDNFP